MTGRPRPEVVELLAYHHPQLSDFSAKPWNLYHLDDARPFTPAEAAIANSATPDEVLAAQRLALAQQTREQRKYKDLRRAMELLALVPGWESLEVREALSRLPRKEQEEAVELFSRYGPEDLGL